MFDGFNDFVRKIKLVIYKIRKQLPYIEVQW